MWQQIVLQSSLIKILLWEQLLCRHLSTFENHLAD